jgi:hypothetical protein
MALFRKIQWDVLSGFALRMYTYQRATGEHGSMAGIEEEVIKALPLCAFLRGE